MANQTNKSFLISKCQMHILTSLRNQLVIITVVPNYKELKLEIQCEPKDNKITKQILLALHRRKLIKDFRVGENIHLTYLGERMANIGLKPENIGKIIYAKAPTQKDIKVSLGIKLNGKEIEMDAKKKAKQQYNRNLKASYK